MKTYTISTLDVEDEQKTITISETKETTVEEKTSVAQLKEKHAQILLNIESSKVQADEVVDELIAIDAEVNITIKDIPTKLK